MIRNDYKAIDLIGKRLEVNGFNKAHVEPMISFLREVLSATDVNRFNNHIPQTFLDQAMRDLNAGDAKAITRARDVMARFPLIIEIVEALKKQAARETPTDSKGHEFN